MYACMCVCNSTVTCHDSAIIILMMITRIISGQRNQVQRMNRGRMEEFPMNINKREMEQTMNTLVANVEHLGEILPKTVRGSALRVLVTCVCVCVLCIIGYNFFRIIFASERIHCIFCTIYCFENPKWRECCIPGWHGLRTG